MGSNVSESGGLWSSGFKFFYWGIGPPVIKLFVCQVGGGGGSGAHGLLLCGEAALCLALTLEASRSFLGLILKSSP